MQDVRASLDVRVAEIRPLSSDIKLFELRSAGAEALPPFDAGAHVDVHMQPGTTRQYSLCNAPAERDRYLIAVKREDASSGGSRFMHDVLKEGDRLRIGLPRNSFPVVAGAAHHLLLAGGIGITPLLSMARHFASSGESFTLHYFVRTGPEATAFRLEIAEEGLAACTALHHGLGPSETAATIAALLRTRPEDAHLYMCGPAAFMAAVDAAAMRAWPAKAVHREYFSAPEKPAKAGDGSFAVRIASTGKDYPVAAGQSIVAALAAHRIEVETSCRQGICGTCLTGVVSGEIDHRDSFLSEEERRYGDRILACVSRCRGPLLVLDL